MFDRLLFSVFIIGLCIAAFLGGAVTIYYNLSPALILTEAFEGGKAWYKEYTTPQKESFESTPETENKLEKILLNAKVTWEKDKAYDGYTLFTLCCKTSTVFLVDMEGKIVHRWNMPFRKAWPNPSHTRKQGARIHIHQAKTFPNGDLIIQYFGWGDTPYGYGMVKMDKDSNVIWKYSDNAHHDFYIAQDHSIYTLTQQFIKTPIEGLETLNYPNLADFIIKLSPDGKEISKISILEAFRDSPYAHMLTGKSTSKYPWDTLHTNSIMVLEPNIADKFPMFSVGDILVSIRNLNLLAVISPITRKVVWAQRGTWKAQHAASFTEKGTILLLDNKGNLKNSKSSSRIMEIHPNNGDIEWQFVGTKAQHFFTKGMGRTERLPNGNTLITENLGVRTFEVTPENKIVWNYDLPRRRKEGVYLQWMTSSTRYGKDSLIFLQD